MHYVYAYLTEDGTPFYIGAGQRRRDQSHLTLCRSKAGGLPFFYNKLRKMLSDGHEPVVVRLLDNLTKYEAFEIWEPFFICAVGRRDLKTGPLCNLSDGGEGPRNVSESSRLAISQKAVQRFSSKKEREEQSARTTAYFQDPVARKRVSDQMKVLSDSPEWRKTKRDLMNGLWASQEARDLFIAKAKKRWSTPAVREQLSEDAKLRWADSDYRMKQLFTRRNKPGISGAFKGIYFDAHKNRWRASIKSDGKKINLGSHLTDVEAARAYNDAVDKYWNGVGYKNPV